MTTGQRCQGNNQPTQNETQGLQITYFLYSLGDAPKDNCEHLELLSTFLILN